MTTIITSNIISYRAIEIVVSIEYGKEWAVRTLAVANDFKQLTVEEDKPGHVTRVANAIDLVYLISRN